MGKLQDIPFRLHPTDTGFGFEIGAAESHKMPCIMVHPQDFILDTMMMSAVEIGLMMREIMQAVRRHDTKTLSKYRFLGRLYKGYDNARPPIPAAVRRRVLSIGHCVRCGSTEKLEVDHIIPYSKGGAHEESNFQCLCKKCNRGKYNKLEGEA